MHVAAESAVMGRDDGPNLNAGFGLEGIECEYFSTLSKSICIRSMYIGR